MTARTVTRKLLAHLFTDPGTASVRSLGRVSVRWHFTPVDPYAVELAFGDTSGGLVVWSLARDLLTDGLSRPAGVGDVRMLPGARRIRVELSSPTGRAALFFVRDDLAEAIAATERLVPRGAESARIDWDGELARLGVA
jgi:hypothetical protein